MEQTGFELSKLLTGNGYTYKYNGDKSVFADSENITMVAQTQYDGTYFLVLPARTSTKVPVRTVTRTIFPRLFEVHDDFSPFFSVAAMAHFLSWTDRPKNSAQRLCHDILTFLKVGGYIKEFNVTSYSDSVYLVGTVKMICTLL